MRGLCFFVLAPSVRSAGSPGVKTKAPFVRRIVRDYIAAALNRQRVQLEQYIAEQLQYPEAFPLILAGPVVRVREIARVKIVSRLRADFPEVDITVMLRVSIAAESRRREIARGVRTAAVPEVLLGRRTLALDVELHARGAANGRKYDVLPQGARLIAWWGTLANANDTIQ